MSRSPRSRPAAAGALLVALLLPFGIVGCGTSGDDKADPTTTTPTTVAEPASQPVGEWASSVCGALTDWSAEFEQLGSDFDADLDELKEGDVAGVRDLLAEFFGKAADVTHDLGDDLEAVGQPDLGQGEEIAKDLRKGISKVQGELTNTKNQVAELAIDNPAEFSEEIDRLNGEFQDAVDEIGTALDDFESRYDEDGAAIDEVLADDDACADIGA